MARLETLNGPKDGMPINQQVTELRGGGFLDPVFFGGEANVQWKNWL